MRKQRLAYLTKAIDKPTPFTRGTGVKRGDRASTSGSLRLIKAALRVSPLQTKYLTIQEHGGVKTDGAVAVQSNARDAFGDVKTAFHRTSAGLDLLTGKRGTNVQAKFLVGKPSGRCVESSSVITIARGGSAVPGKSSPAIDGDGTPVVAPRPQMKRKAQRAPRL